MTVLLSLKDLGVIAFISAILCVIVVRWLDRRSAGRSSAGETNAKAGNSSPEMVVSRLYVHPIKSCRGIQVDEARFDAKGLEFDRYWAVQEVETGNVATARVYPKMVLVTPTIDRAAGLLRVTFPTSTDASPQQLPGFAVPLNPTPAQVGSWESAPESYMHGMTLPPSVVPQALDAASPSPSAQWSTYLGTRVRFVQTAATLDPSRFKPRSLEGPVPESQEIAYGVDEMQTGFADGYPMLIATEESLADVQAAVLESPHSTAVGSVPASDHTALDLRRFRPNVVLQGSGEAWAEDLWRELEIRGRDGKEERRSDVVCVKRCGRCQLPNVDPATGDPDKSVPYKVIAGYRRVDPSQKYTPIFGTNAVPKFARGLVRVGDRVRVVSWNAWESLDGRGEPLVSKSRGR